MNQPNADRRADRMTVHVLAICAKLSRIRADRPNPTTHRLSRGANEYRQHAVADRVAKAIVNQFESVKIDRQNSGWSRIFAVALGEQRGILQKRAAICDTSKRVDHGSRTVAEFCALLRHRKQDKGTRDGQQQDSKLSTVIHTLLNTLSLTEPGSSATRGVRSKNNAPWANRMKMAGQRDTKSSSRPRQDS